MSIDEKVKQLEAEAEKVRKEREEKIQAMMISAGITQYIDDSNAILKAYGQAIALLKQPDEEPKEDSEAK